MRSGWQREPGRHALAAKGVRTSILPSQRARQYLPHESLNSPWPTFEDSETFVEQYARIEAMPDGREKKKLMFDLLHDLTTLQDYVQLSIPHSDTSTTDVTVLTNDVNAIMLALARSGGDLEYVAHDSYFREKIEALNKHTANAMHDYNLTAESSDRIVKEPEFKWTTKRDRVNPEHFEQKAYMFRGELDE